LRESKPVDQKPFTKSFLDPCGQGCSTRLKSTISKKFKKNPVKQSERIVDSALDVIAVRPTHPENFVKIHP